VGDLVDPACLAHGRANELERVHRGSIAPLN
jgi:hypothetical protein